ncbi:aspartyl protease family protein [Bacteroides acidifaciens]|uniref:aspartyl protease family protein n=1 Tax=Bacteroides acidifaciens TaxID=85831 RepID=UPI00158D0481|nr:aspartyl protease family protein [Bacteroides acidifaciens]
MQKYYPIFILLSLLVSCNPKRETKYYFKEYDMEGWLIPVHIGEETYDFVFDTGSSNSHIESKLANKLKLKIIDSTLIFEGRNKKISYHSQTEKLEFNIANIPMSTSFYYTTDNRNIIGMDIIKKYHWMFDRANKTFRLQEKPISIEKRPSDMIYEKQYRFNDIEVQVPIVDLLINDTISIPLLFDSGYAYTHIYNADTTDITMPPTITLEYYDQINDNGFIRYIYDMYGNDALTYWIPSNFTLWLDSIAIDNLPPSDFYMPVDVDSIYKKVNKGYIGLLTWHFARQFRTLYINPEKQELTFIVSPQDSNLINHPTNEEGLYLKHLRKLRHMKK